MARSAGPKTLSQLLLNEPTPHEFSREALIDYIHRLMLRLTAENISHTFTAEGTSGISGSIRRAKVQSVASSNVSVKLLNSSGSETGSAFNVTAVNKLGSNDYDGDVWPNLAADDIIPVFEDVDGNWYWLSNLDDITLCS